MLWSYLKSPLWCLVYFEVFLWSFLWFCQLAGKCWK
jgi:hypothetical protein